MQYKQLCDSKKWNEAIDCARLLFPHKTLQGQQHLLRQSLNQLSDMGRLKTALSVGIQLEDTLLRLGESLIDIQIEIAVLYTRLGHKKKPFSITNKH